VLIVMKAGARMVDHRVETTASLYVLSGLLRLHLPGKPMDLPALDLLALEANLRHDVEAVEQSAFLLTIGWRDGAR
jgi:quercetin dioxygenase-like cupin family protein